MSILTLTNTHIQSNEACNDSQISHHHWEEWSFCYTQTLTHTHPQFSQADTSIRLILPAYKMLHFFSLNQQCWIHAIFLCFLSCSASQVEELYSVMEERIRNDRFHFQAEARRGKMQGSRDRETERRKDEGKVVGGWGRPERLSIIAICFLHPYIPLENGRYGVRNNSRVCP